MNLCVPLGETASVLKGVDGIPILVTPDCLDSLIPGKRSANPLA